MVVTGGFGFIGSSFIRAIQSAHTQILNIDLDTYAGDDRRLSDIPDGRVENIRLDVADPDLFRVLKPFQPEVVVHFAAESHVTRSETDSARFEATNVVGTRNVLEAATVAGASLIVHVSTDEIYGPCLGQPFSENAKLLGEGLATSAYARSKAVADDIAHLWDRAPVIVVRPTNCFGPWQHPEKAVARWATKAIAGRRVPVWGDGRQIRDWVFIDDACRALLLLIELGEKGEVYNIGPEEPQRTNLEIATLVATAAGAPDSVYLTAYDRPQHDRRYAIDSAKIRALGWTQSDSLDRNLVTTVDWYRHNRWWWESLVDEAESIYDDSLERR